MEASSLIAILMHHLIAAYLITVVFHSRTIVETINSIARTATLGKPMHLASDKTEDKKTPLHIP